jgi:uncharacterized membrane protein
VTPTIIAFLPVGLIGCLSCNEDLRAAILDHRFTLLLLTIPPVTLAGGVLAGWVAALITRRMRGDTPGVLPVAGTWPAAVTGAGLGALFDGILLHEVLQVHDMISNSLPPVTALSKGVNVFWSGIFDLCVFILIVAGIAASRHHERMRQPAPARAYWGSFLFGWGFFNCYDVLTFHWLLRYHDVVEVTDAPVAWNVGWLLMGVAIAVCGILLMRRHGPAAAHPSSVPR